jgi:uncharacterized membrane protein
MIDRIDSDRGVSLVLVPNCSSSWRDSVRVIAALAATSLATGLGLALNGAWLVLPLAGAEVAAMALCFLVLARRASRREVITFAADTVTVERGVHAPDEAMSFPRAFSSILVQRRHPWYPRRIAIRGHGREIEIGSFLAEGERASLVAELSRIVNAPAR